SVPRSRVKPALAGRHRNRALVASASHQLRGRASGAPSLSARMLESLMRRRRRALLDCVTKGPTRNAYARMINASLASIVPPVIATWCEQAGHEVNYVCYPGAEDVTPEVVVETDILFISAFTRSALAAYAIANVFRRRGTVTVLGGPHARCY